MTLPAPGSPTARLFPGVETILRDGSHRDFVALRLLEAGHRGDLARLAERFTRAELEALFTRHGGRRLSARSRRFWARLLDLPAPAPSAIAEELWPLA
ncbi:MAG: hypothetical protein R2862_04015 [Thermoanaerobaculia bacterium]